jgi:syringomycin synthetase protein SyrE
MSSAYSLEGQLDINVLEKVFEILAGRHESLRTVFITIDGQPKQKIIPGETMLFQIHPFDLPGEEPEPSKHMKVQQFIDSEFRTLFDLSIGPLLRVKLLTVARYRYVFLFTMHHIISDAVSMQVLFREVFLLYNSMKKGGGNPLKPLKIQYKDYTAWQNNRLKGEQLEKLKCYWFEQLSAPLPTLELPFDHPRPQVLTFNGAEFSFTVDELLTRQLKAIGEQHDATLFMVLLTALKGLLFRYSGQTDIVVGTVIAGREHADLYDQIGFYLNTLALRTRFNPEDSFAVLLKKVRHVCLEAYDHQLYSFDRLVGQLGIRRDVSRNPIFDVMVDMINTDTGTAANANPAGESDLIIRPLGFDEIKSKYDLTVYIFEGNRTLSFIFEYNRDLFENTTIRRMAKRLQALLENVVKNPYTGISDLKVEDVPVFSPLKPVSPTVETEVQLPASYHQERLWFIDRFEAGYIYPSGPVYHNIPLLLEIDGALNIELLEQSIKEVIRGHQALRTRVITRDNRPFQSIRPSVDFHLEVKDALQGPGDGLSETAVKLAVEETQRPFLPDQDQGPLIRGLLMKIKDNSKFLLVITVHHIIADRYSLEILAREILSYYEAFPGNKPSPQLEDSSFQYGDFSQWQRAFSDHQIESLLFYWRWKLRGKLQALELPTDRPRAPIHIYQSGWHPFAFAETLNDKINSFVGHNNHLVLLAAFKTLLYHYSGQEEIVVGTGMRNRTQPGTEGIIGPIANLVVLRSFLTRGTTFNELLSQLKKAVAEARKYQVMPFDRLVLELKPDVDMSRTALFDVLFQYEENPFQLPEVGNLKINAIETNLGWGKYDLNLLIQRNEDRFSGVLVYNRDYHNESTISRLIGHFMVLLEEVLSAPHQKISQFNLLTVEEHQQLLIEWNQPQIDYPKGKTIHGIFREQAAVRPDAIAVQGQIVGAQGTVPVPMDHVSLTYKELNEKSNQLAYVLRQKGVAADTIVAMLMERSVEMIVAILGILKAGGAYLPIDPDYPQERIDFILKDSNARILLKKSEIRISKSETNPNDQNSNDQNKKSMPIVLDFEHLDFEFVSSFGFRASDLLSSNLAYVIYTSGTTGQPKGCLITHKNVISLLKNKIQAFDFNENDVWTMFHQYNFDFSVWEMYGALLYGGKLIVIPRMVTRDPGQYLEILKREKVTVLNQTPSAFYRLSAAEMSQSGFRLYIRYVIFGGEALNPAKLKQWKVKYPGTRLINMFGITETTIHVTYKEIGGKEIECGTGNIGRPVSTLTAYVVGRDFNLLPIGIPGELCVGGEGLARGYLNRPELTAKKFINKKFLRGVQGGSFYKKSPPGRRRPNLYKSGDLVKLLENGDMEYLGRIDHQVQIRGFRIELGEIENQLSSHRAVKEAVVICIEDDREAGDKTLCACIVSDKGLDAVEMRDFLSRRLPGYMVPSLFKRVDHIPLTPNGKVDGKALRSSGTRLGAGAEYVPPATPTETRIAGIWREILKLDKNEVEIGIHDNFFDIGGTSMDVVRVNAKIAEEFEKQIPIVTMYKYTTIRALSGFLDRGEAGDQDMVSEEKRADRIQKGRADKNKMRDKRKRGRTKNDEYRERYRA